MSRTTRQLSQSMHEMYEIPDLKAYADAMKEMDDKIPKTEEDDDFLLLDLSSSDRSIEMPARPIQVTTGSSPMMRRCSMSCARLPSEVDRQRRTFSLMTMHGSTIEEEGRRRRKRKLGPKILPCMKMFVLIRLFTTESE